MELFANDICTHICPIVISLLRGKEMFNGSVGQHTINGICKRWKASRVKCRNKCYEWRGRMSFNKHPSQRYRRGSILIHKFKRRTTNLGQHFIIILCSLCDTSDKGKKSIMKLCYAFIRSAKSPE